MLRDRLMNMMGENDDGYNEGIADAAMVSEEYDVLLKELHKSLIMVLSWCEDVAGDVSDEDQAEDEEFTIRYAKDTIATLKKLEESK